MNFITTIRRLFRRFFVKESPMTDPVQPAAAGTVVIDPSAAAPFQVVPGESADRAASDSHLTSLVSASASQAQAIDGIAAAVLSAQTVAAGPSVDQLKAEVAALKAELAKVEPARQKFVELLKSVGHDVGLVASEAWALVDKAI